jgi:putative transcriptional regulator
VNFDHSLAGQLLIAMPSLGDPNFQRTVVLLAAHSFNDGAFGLVVNRPLEVEFTEILDELGLDGSAAELPMVLGGGPVEPGHGFVLFESDDDPPGDSDLCLPEGLSLSGSIETLGDLISGEGQGNYALVLGYAGWFPGQLETEIEENSWLVAPVQTSILFEVPYEERWKAALDSIGVDPGTIADVGADAPPA